MKKTFLLLALMLSATSAWATGINSFTVVGSVTSVHCFEFLEAPTLSCLVELEGAAKDTTQVICSDPMTAGACRWLEEGDKVLILGHEKSEAKQATHVAMLLHDIPHEAQGAKALTEDDQRQRMQDMKNAVALEEAPDR